MKADRLTQAHGNWVEGDQFWDREDDITLFAEKLAEGAHLLLVAQRRMGKTSLMREMMRQLDDEYVCLFVDLQKAASAAETIVELALSVRPHRSLWGKAKGVFGNVLGKIRDMVDKVELGDLAVTLRSGITAGDWASKGNQLLAVLAASKKPVIVFCDEVPIMVNRLLKGSDGRVRPEGKTRADEFMSWLRQNTIDHKGKIRFVVSGSIGFEPVLHQARLSATLNTFESFELKPWTDDVAIACLGALARQSGLDLGEGGASQIVKMLGCNIPHHVQMFFGHIHDRCKRKGVTRCSAKDIRAIYKNEMLGARGHVELTHYEERLAQVLGADALPLALEMLTEAAVVGKLTDEVLAVLRDDYSFEEQTAVEVQREILGVIEHDGYLRHMPRGYVFISKLLKDWWKNRHQYSYTPVSKRGV